MVDLPTYCLTAPYLPIDLPIKDKERAAPDRVEHACDAARIEESPRYAAKDGKTYCNILAWDITAACGCEVPHWFDTATGEATKVGVGTEMSANRMWAWLSTHGIEWGWTMGSLREDAVRWAQRGEVVLAVWKAPSGPGHVAVVLPDGKAAQAGKQCYRRKTLEQCFGDKLAEVRYFGHD